LQSTIATNLRKASITKYPDLHFFNRSSNMSIKSVLALLSVTLFYQCASAQQCPPEGFDAVQAFDIEKFVGERWYSIRQLPVIYQPENQFNCVFAQYDLVSRKSLRCLFSGCSNPPSISVFNSARDGSTTGRPVSVNFVATIPNAETEPAKAFVAPGFVPNFLRRSTNYWVAAVGTYNELPGLEAEPASSVYQFALITSGEAGVLSKNSKCYSSGGMWFFSRLPVPPNGFIEAMEGIATNLGLDPAVLKPVNQTGCNYENAEGGFLSGFRVLIKGFFS
jgi:lipocalin